jgi:precorrin-3B methylase
VPEIIKSQSIIESDLRRELRRAKDDLQRSWPDHKVAIVAALFLVVGFLIGLVI